MDTVIVNTGNGNTINTGGGRNVDAEVQVSSNTTEGATPDNAVNGTEVVAENGNSNGDSETTNQGEIQSISIQISGDEKALDDYVSMSIAKDLAAYNALTIKRLYPKSWDKFFKYCRSKANDIEEIDEETSMGLLLAAPRTVLPDFFDQNGIFVNTEYNGKWAYNIKTNNILIQVAFTYGIRVTAEIAAFMKAFEILEEKL